MKLEEIQPAFVAWLEAAPAFAAAQVLVLANDGSYPKMPEREAALTGTLAGKGKGLILVVHFPKPSDTVATTVTGLTVFDVLMHVVIEENVIVNRGDGGTDIAAERALTLVLAALVGKKTTTNHNDTVRIFGVPFRHFGAEEGLRAIVANFEVRLYAP